MSAVRRLLALAALGLLTLVVLGFPSAAQTVRGVVVDAASRPVAGLVVQLVDSSSVVAARALSNERGEFQLAASRAGLYTVRMLRIGYRPETSAPVRLLVGGEATQRLVLAGVPISLDTVRVVGRNACRSAADSGAAVFAAWEQARTALTATQLTAGARNIAATTVTYERILDPTGKQIQKQTTSVSADFVTQPWRSAPADSLRRAGYVAFDVAGSTVYFAPGLDVLLSNGFVEDHCLRITTDRDRSRIGIAFEPTSARKRVPEIRGTLWLDRATSELRTLEFRYVNIPPEQADIAAGEMQFTRMKNGAWAESRWTIKMPVLVQVLQQHRFGGEQVKVAEVRVAGGELALARQGTDTLWARPPFVVSGTVQDSVSGASVVGARVAFSSTGLQGTTDARGRFTISGALPGEYTVEVRTPSLDSVSAVHESMLVVTDAATQIDLRVPSAREVAAAVCPTGMGNGRGNGIVLGRVTRLGDSVPPARVKVVAEWTDLTLRAEAITPVAQPHKRWLETGTSARGDFRLCGVPIGSALTITAEADSVVAAPVAVQIPESGRFARTSLTLDRVARRTALLTGLVVDSTAKPILGAEVSLPDVSKVVLANERGVFQIADVPAGSHRVLVRHIGYSPADTTIVFTLGQTVDWRFILKRAVQLDSVVVNAAHRDVLMEEFEENRKLGLGHFLTREQIAKLEGLQISASLEGIPGLHLAYARLTTHAYIMSKGLLFGGDAYIPQRGDEPGVTAGCYVQVYLDGTLMNPPVTLEGAPPGRSKRATPPFDVNSIPPNQIEAIEYYATPAQTPARYSGLGSNCGVYLIHTRRVK